ncbi:glycosyl hydrolase family 18 protein [Streptomyces zagrosensis]|uniref:Spore germination protein YaaH n=1 Tax=Streptomyces zagrosensis TaxID=1042984 RepID=A0A7W9UZP0_9ACTN|nr:glycosyl hydrolase family 18 protein [Streptomyces zagrosensis]MBB5936556.1 spore germination protein YaaH [Streptomyces zagrosensis]
MIFPRALVPVSVLALLALTSPAASAGADTGAAGPPPAPRRTVSAWLPYWQQDGAYRDALAHADQLHTVSPFWYEMTSTQRITAHPGAGEHRIIDGLHRAGIKVVPTVTEAPNAAAMAALLTDPSRRAAHADTLLRLADSRPYDGLDLDYERMNHSADPAVLRRVRNGFSALVSEVCARLHARGKQCTVAVYPRTHASDTAPAYDYARLGRAVDRLRIMGYNLHNALGPPGPLSSPAWYDAILRYATSRVPADRIEMGIPAYGWDYRAGDRARATHRTTREAEALRRRVGAPYALDAASKTPHFTYADNGRRREVWYQDARGIAAHLPVLHRHGVVNTALWALDFEEAGLWPTLERGARREMRARTGP